MPNGYNTLVVSGTLDSQSINLLRLDTLNGKKTKI